MEEKENDEYRKRVKELIDKVEKGKDEVKDNSIGEVLVLEAQERVLQKAKSKIHPDFRDFKIVLLFAYTIRDLLKKNC